VAAGAGAAASRLHLSSPALPMASYGAPGRRFARSFEERYGAAPGPWAIFGYEAMSATIAAIRAAGPQAKQREAVIHAFFRIRDRRSALGTYSIERSGETTRTTLAGYGVRDGQLVFDHMLQTAR
jgi:branched-chain amino acid transport system substrate-binding protein